MSLILLLDSFSGGSGGPLPVTSAGIAAIAAGLGVQSSALGLADLALVWSGLDADLTIVDQDLSVDAGMTTAVLLSLCTDRRCEDDDVPSSGDVDDRRGWWADQFADVEGDRFGSRLWLLDRSKRTNETALRAKEYAAEALAWMVEDSVVESVDVVTELTTSDLLIGVTVQRPGREPIALRFAHTWSAMEAA